MSMCLSLEHFLYKEVPESKSSHIGSLVHSGLLGSNHASRAHHLQKRRLMWHQPCIVRQTCQRIRRTILILILILIHNGAKTLILETLTLKFCYIRRVGVHSKEVDVYSPLSYFSRRRPFPPHVGLLDCNSFDIFEMEVAFLRLWILWEGGLIFVNLDQRKE